MIKRSIMCAYFMSFAIFKDANGKTYSVDLLDDITQEVKLPQMGTHLIWEDNFLVGAAEVILHGGLEKNRPWPFGLRTDDDSFVPWNRWIPLTDGEKAAEIPGLPS